MNKGRNGSTLLDQPLLVRQGLFTTDEAQKVLGWPRNQLNPILFRLVRKGKLMRIKRGLFCIKLLNWYVIARALAGDRPYFISYYSAMQLHGMTGESIQTVFVSSLGQLQVPRSPGIPIRFVTLSKKHLWGREEKWVTNEEKVQVSDLERTIIDALDRLDLSGGIMEAARGMWLVKKKINFSQLVNDARRFNSQAVAKRLGFLMELLNLGSAGDREKIRQFALLSPSYVLFDPTLRKKGRYLHAWRLVLNQDPQAIKENIMT